MLLSQFKSDPWFCLLIKFQHLVCITSVFSVLVICYYSNREFIRAHIRHKQLTAFIEQLKNIDSSKQSPNNSNWRWLSKCLIKKSWTKKKWKSKSWHKGTLQLGIAELIHFHGQFITTALLSLHCNITFLKSYLCDCQTHAQISGKGDALPLFQGRNRGKGWCTLVIGL